MRLLAAFAEEIAALRMLDPACDSGKSAAATSCMSHSRWFADMRRRSLFIMVSTLLHPE
jgi:hypothetical protein